MIDGENAVSSNPCTDPTANRLAALRATELLDTSPEPAFDRFTELACRVLHAPISLISLVEEDRQFFKSSSGLPEPWKSRRQTPLSHSFCQHVVQKNEPIIISDARTHPLVRENLAINDLGVIAYLGFPLLTPGRQVIGSLCAIDNRPRDWSENDVQTLGSLAQAVMTEIELRCQNSDREQSYKAVETAGRYAESIVETLRESLLVLDKDLRVSSANSSFYSTFHVSAEETHGKLIYELGHGEWEIPALRELLEDILPDQIELEDFEVEFDSPAIGSRTMLLNARQLRRKDVGRKLILLAIQDITKRRHAERDREQLIVRLQTLNTELDQYAYAVSHDIRTPLRAIHSYADFLHEDLHGRLEAEQQEYLDGMRTAVHQAEALANDLLQLSKVGRKGSTPESVDVGALVRQVVASIRPGKDSEVVVSGNWPTVETLPQLLRQIFTNLVTNALKFNSSPTKRVELGASPMENGQFHFYVKDNGIGIDAKHHGKVFGVFERLHTQNEYDGTGVGLAIVRKAAVTLGGSVRLDSVVGRGSTFFLTLPPQLPLE